MSTRIHGKHGEQAARAYLEQRMYMTCIAENWQCKLGEVDLIMRDGHDDTLVFVEVRTRQPTSYGTGDETVARDKRQKLIRTAQLYQQQENYWGDIRFDVVSIEWPDGADAPTDITHIPHAFDVSP